MRHPDFFVVGAAKSGTTALWRYFQEHPNLFVTSNIAHKELGYYSEVYGVKDLDYYLNFFKEANSNQLIGEVCHAYLSDLSCAKTIQSHMPEAKIIIMLRNPVFRAYSLYNWMVMHGYEELSTFQKALNREEKIISGDFRGNRLLHPFLQNYMYLHSGLYSKQVQQYLDVFGKDNVLILDYDEFKGNQTNTLIKIFAFLGVKEIAMKPHSSNKSKRLRSIRLQKILRKIFKSRLGRFNLVKRVCNKLMSLNIVHKPPINLSKDKKRELWDFFKDDALNLDELCNTNFHDRWKNQIS